MKLNVIPLKPQGYFVSQLYHKTHVGYVFTEDFYFKEDLVSVYGRIQQALVQLCVGSHMLSHDLGVSLWLHFVNRFAKLFLVVISSAMLVNS